MAWEEDNYIATLLGQANSMNPSFMRAPVPGNNNVLAQISGTEPGAEPRRKRASVVDIIGGLADSVAQIGGVDAGYQPTIDARLAREREAEIYPLEKQKLELGNQSTKQEMTFNQNEFLGRVAQKLAEVRDKAGPEAAARMFMGVSQQLGMSPQEAQAASAQIMADPTVLDAWSTFGESANGTEFGTTVYYDKDAEGNLYPYQVSKSGGKQYLNSPDGRTPAPLLSIQDTGLGFQGISRQTALPVGAPVDKTGDLGKGIILSTPEGGGAPVVAPIQGGEMDLKLTEDVRDLQTLGNGLSSFEDIFPEIRRNIDAMASAGSLSGVPDDAVDAEGQPLRGGSNLGAIAMQNIPLLEQATNEKGFSAREQIRSAGRVMVQQLQPLLTQAQSSGANLTSRMMDTPKELEGLLEQVINTKDYGAALKAYERFKTRYNEVRREVQEKLKAAQGRTAVGRQQPTASTPKAPTVSNW